MKKSISVDSYLLIVNKKMFLNARTNIGWDHIISQVINRAVYYSDVCNSIDMVVMMMYLFNKTCVLEMLYRRSRWILKC